MVSEAAARHGSAAAPEPGRAAHPRSYQQVEHLDVDRKMAAGWRLSLAARRFPGSGHQVEQVLDGSSDQKVEKALDVVSEAAARHGDAAAPEPSRAAHPLRIMGDANSQARLTTRSVRSIQRSTT